ncbi:hypothetical protein BJV77DRAFT_962219 [Russula vinacea]|nr:hypothetical protein BJV77DRAFT_962219 [Russula vinacea]
MPFSSRFVTKQVEEALQPNADGAFRGDGDHVRAVDHILDVSVVVTFLVIRAWFSELDPATHSPPTWLPMLSAILLVNLIVTDGVVSGELGRHPCIDTLVYVITVAARAGLLITPEGAQSHHDLARIIDIAQVGNLALSLLTNALATSIIAVKCWIYRKTLISCNVGGQTSTLASKVMGLLVESGMLYILIIATVLASCLIRLPFGTLGDILAPVGVQLAGIYPIIVLLVADQTSSPKSTPFHSSSFVIHNNEDQPPPLEPLNFAPGLDSHQSSRSLEED